MHFTHIDYLGIIGVEKVNKMIQSVRVLRIPTNTLEHELNDRIKTYKSQNLAINLVTPLGKDLYLLQLTSIYDEPGHAGFQDKRLVDQTQSNQATQKQINYLKTLAQETGQEVKTTGLTKRQAGQKIGELKRLKNKPKDQGKADNFHPKGFSPDELEDLFKPGDVQS